MSDTGDFWRGVKDERKKQKRLFGLDCPKCKIVQPRRIPTRLLPGQSCKVCKYRAPRRKEYQEYINRLRSTDKPND